MSGTTKQKRVIVIIRGGLIQDVVVPKGIRVIVRDYDTDGMIDDGFKIDAAGKSYSETIY